MFEKFKHFKHFRSVAAGVLALLLFGVGGVVGRATTPVRVEERIQVKTVEVEKIRTEWKDRIVTQTVYVKDTHKDVVKTEKEVIRPDGTIEREKTEHEADQTVVEVAQASAQEHFGSEDKIRQTVQTVLSEKKTIPAPEWSVALMVGVAPRAGFMPPLGPPPLVAGVHVQKRIIGPLNGGVWVLTNPSLGVSLGAQF
jgi:hypothetical protein